MKKNRNENKAVKMNGKLLTTEEAALTWGIRRKAIYRLVREGKIRPIGGFKSWMFTGDELEPALERL